MSADAPGVPAVVPRAFALTWDYRCPFARIAAEHVLDGLEAGAEWDVRWLPFSLTQGHAAPGEAWADPAADSGLLALEVAVVVRDRFPDRFLALHRALFEARHAQGASLRDRDGIKGLLADQGLDPSEVLDEVDAGWPRRQVRAEHEEGVDRWDVWGVPTFVAADRAAFVRLTERPTDPQQARTAVERIVDLLVDWPALNEFKHTTLDR